MANNAPFGSKRPLWQRVAAGSALAAIPIGLASYNLLSNDRTTDCGDSKLASVEHTFGATYKTVGMTATAPCTEAFRPSDGAFEGNLDVGDVLIRPCYDRAVGRIAFSAGYDFLDETPDNQKMERYYVIATEGAIDQAALEGVEAC